jgi:O-antigen/teichoic acid export membrane protein
MSVKVLLRSSVFAVFDQAIQSAGNLAASVFLIAYGTKAGFGLYGIGYASALLVIGLLSALFVNQTVILAPHAPQEEQLPFFAAILAAQTMASVLLAMIASTGIIALWAADHLSSSATILALVVGIGATFLSRQEFYRAASYYFGRPFLPLLLSLTQVAVWAVTSLTGWLAGIEDLAPVVLAGWCLGAAVASLLARFLFPLPRVSNTAQIHNAVARVWEQGSWSVLGVLAAWVQNQGYAWLLLALASVEAVAETNFSKLFYSPLLLALGSFNKVAAPHLSKIFAADGAVRTLASGRQILAVIVLLSTLYIVMVVLLRDIVLPHVSGGAYAGVGDLLLAWGLVTAVQSIRWNATLTLGVFRRNHQMTLVGFIAAGVGLAASVLLIPIHGALGAILAIALAEIVFALLLWWNVFRFVAVEKAKDAP